MIIDYKTLSADALQGVATQFVLSKVSEVEESPDIAQWTAQVIKNLMTGELLIEYSEVDSSVTIKAKSDFKILDCRSA